MDQFSMVIHESEPELRIVYAVSVGRTLHRQMFAPYNEQHHFRSPSPSPSSQALDTAAASAASPAVGSPVIAHHLEAPHPLRRCRSASPLPQLKPQGLSSERQVLIKPPGAIFVCIQPLPAQSEKRKSSVDLDGEGHNLRSWQRVPRQQFSEHFMNDLILRLGRQAFGDADDVYRHRRHFVDLVGSVVENLADMEPTLQEWAETIERGHAGMKVKTRNWDAFGEALMTAITPLIARGKTHKETVKSWTMLSSMIADRLAAAARSTSSSTMSPMQHHRMLPPQPQTALNLHF